MSVSRLMPNFRARPVFYSPAPVRQRSSPTVSGESVLSSVRDRPHAIWLGQSLPAGVHRPGTARSRRTPHDQSINFASGESFTIKTSCSLTTSIRTRFVVSLFTRERRSSSFWASRSASASIRGRSESYQLVSVYDKKTPSLSPRRRLELTSIRRQTRKYRFVVRNGP